LGKKKAQSLSGEEINQYVQKERCNHLLGGNSKERRKHPSYLSSEEGSLTYGRTPQSIDRRRKGSVVINGRRVEVAPKHLLQNRPASRRRKGKSRIFLRKRTPFLSSTSRNVSHGEGAAVSRRIESLKKEIGYPIGRKSFASNRKNPPNPSFLGVRGKRGNLDPRTAKGKIFTADLP